MELQREDLEKLYAETFRGLQAGEITRGKIIQIKQEGILVDVGYKSEGIIPAEELSEEEFKTFKPGGEVEVYITGIRDSYGFMVLSKERATKIKTWDMLQEAYEKGLSIEGKIIGKVKGGMTVYVEGIRAFLPGSHIDIKPLKDKDMNNLMDRSFPFKIIKINHNRSNVILSRRVLLEEERGKLRGQTLSKLQEGAIVTGVVKNLTDYGAFVDLGGVDGLLHISDMSWGRISHPGELFSIGDSVDVIVLKFDQESERVTLGYKQKKPDPWTMAEEKYPQGKKVTGKVISITDYGIFVELEEGLEGLVHVTELDWMEKVKKPSKYFSVGDTVEAVVLKIAKDDKRISLSIKQLKPNPWHLISQTYKVGQIVTGKVRSFTDFGAFVSLEEGIDALLHISDMSWTKHIKHPADFLKRGQKIDAVVLSIEPEKERMALGLRNLTPDPWIEEIPDKYKLGDYVEAKIIRIADFGLFVELEGDIEGLIYLSEIEKPSDKKIDEIYKVGDDVTARIIKIDVSERKIGLGMKMMVGS